MVVVTDASTEELHFERFRCGTTATERELLLAWLQKRAVEEVVMESTAQYGKPVWMDLEPYFGKGKLHLAQAFSNRAPQGRKHDFADAERLARRLLAGELILSFVPDAEQRGWRTMTRTRVQLIRDRIRLQNQLEAALEEMRIKLSSVISELFGLSGRRILQAMAEGETDPVKLADLGDFRLKCGKAELADALRGNVSPMHRQLLGLFLERLNLLDQQIHSLETMAAAAIAVMVSGSSLPNNGAARNPSRGLRCKPLLPETSTTLTSNSSLRCAGKTPVGNGNSPCSSSVRWPIGCAKARILAIGIRLT